jgi:CRP-like cAMP-binding protein
VITTDANELVADIHNRMPVILPLMADDRIDGDELPLTHEFLGLMLGTHRPGVTIALQALEKAGLITTRRSWVTIVDRKALEKNSNGTYVRSNGH